MKSSLILGLFFWSGIAVAQSKPNDPPQALEKSGFLSLKTLDEPIDFENIDYPRLRSALFYFTNEERKKAGLSPFASNNAIENAAQGHADDMVNFGFYSHTSKVRNKKTVTDRMQLAGVNGFYFGENICSTYGLQYQTGRKVNPPYPKGQFTYAFTSQREVIPPHTYGSFAKSVIKLWMDSPGHRTNILNPKFTTLGCGVRLYQERKFYNMPYFMAVQNFSGS